VRKTAVMLAASAATVALILRAVRPDSPGAGPRSSPAPATAPEAESEAATSLPGKSPHRGSATVWITYLVLALLAIAGAGYAYWVGRPGEPSTQFSNSTVRSISVWALQAKPQPPQFTFFGPGDRSIQASLEVGTRGFANPGEPLAVIDLVLGGHVQGCSAQPSTYQGGGNCEINVASMYGGSVTWESGPDTKENDEEVVVRAGSAPLPLPAVVSMYVSSPSPSSSSDNSRTVVSTPAFSPREQCTESELREVSFADADSRGARICEEPPTPTDVAVDDPDPSGDALRIDALNKQPLTPGSVSGTLSATPSSADVLHGSYVRLGEDAEDQDYLFVAAALISLGLALLPLGIDQFARWRRSSEQ
jgi:hypothetical protein